MGRGAGDADVGLSSAHLQALERVAGQMVVERILSAVEGLDVVITAKLLDDEPHRPSKALRSPSKRSKRGSGLGLASSAVMNAPPGFGVQPESATIRQGLLSASDRALEDELKRLASTVQGQSARAA